MSKLRSDSKWGALSAEQRETLEGWLFEENAGYREALERAQKEFGITASLTSLAEYYRHLAGERMEREFLEVKETMGGVNAGNLGWEELGGTAMTLMAKRMIQLAVESPGRVTELVSLGRVLVANEGQEIRRRWLEIEEERIARKLKRKREWADQMAGVWAEMDQVQVRKPVASRAVNRNLPAEKGGA